MKPFYKSKTMIFQFLTLLAGAAAIAFPSSGISKFPDFITSHMAQITMAWGMIGMILRSITKDKVILTE